MWGLGIVMDGVLFVAALEWWLVVEALGGWVILYLVGAIPIVY